MTGTTFPEECSTSIRRKKRMTKSEVYEFVNWCFDDVRYDDLIYWSSGKIVKEYKKDKGIDLSPQFVNLQRRSWIMKGETLIRL